MRKLVIIISMSIILLSSCASSGRFIINIMYDDIGNLKVYSQVYHDNTVIGTVRRIFRKGNEHQVVIVIKDEFIKKINKRAKFYLVDPEGNTKITMLYDESEADKIDSGITIRGCSEKDYHIDKIRNKAKNTFSDIKEFFKSDEWQNTRKALEHNIDELKNKTSKELRKDLPMIKQKIENIKEKYETYSPEIKEQVKLYTDSLRKEIRKIEGYDNESETD